MVNESVISHLSCRCQFVRGFRTALLFASVVLILTRMSLGQDAKVSKIPDGEAQFTTQQLEQYYGVYQNPDVQYLRTLFDTYLNSSGGTPEERQAISKWSKDYFRSKFVVLSRDRNTFGGTSITIVFQDRPDKVFVAWVYPEGAEKDLRLRRFDVGNFNDEDIRRIKIRYKRLLEDKIHPI